MCGYRESIVFDDSGSLPSECTKYDDLYSRGISSWTADPPYRRDVLVRDVTGDTDIYSNPRELYCTTFVSVYWDHGAAMRPKLTTCPHARTGHGSRLELTYLYLAKRESFSGARENDSDVAVPDAWQGGGGKNLLPGPFNTGTGKARGD